MAKHVFVDPATNAATYTFNATAAFNGGAVGNIGIWSLDSSLHLTGAGAATSLLNAGNIIPTKFQVVQNTTSNRPYASPIIEASNVQKITYSRHLAAGLPSTTGSVAHVAFAAGRTHSLKIVKLTGYDNYEEFVNPTGSYDDRIDQVRNYSSTHTTNLATTIVDLANAINNDKGSFVTATFTATNITITAKDRGTNFRVIDVSVALDPTLGLAFAAGSLGTFAYTAGVGMGHKAVEAEKKSRFHGQGHMNRIYFPNTPEMFAAATGLYHILCIHAGNGIQGDTGARKDELIIEMWIPSLADDANAACKVDDIIAGYDLTGGVAAGDTIVLYQK